MKALIVSCCVDNDTAFGISSAKDSMDMIEIEASEDGAQDHNCIVMAIDKLKAEQIVNHLIKVFDITPEQRNK